MSLITNTKAMDYAYFGEPFVRLSTVTDSTAGSMDYAYFGEPFWFVAGGGNGGSTGGLTGVQFGVRHGIRVGIRG